jgi:hypothetical protein
MSLSPYISDTADMPYAFYPYFKTKAEGWDPVAAMARVKAYNQEHDRG